MLRMTVPFPETSLCLADDGPREALAEPFLGDLLGCDIPSKVLMMDPSTFLESTHNGDFNHVRFGVAHCETVI
jgi:hypothetical protein